ncbi:BspA family leucine-rich repeat surface protein [Brachyspira pulli]|uniref:BspA family leucine-rich repeat surface protein n=1 Tax=Brachyspira pulli TaxID=310721 RepID=UPI003007371C
MKNSTSNLLSNKFDTKNLDIYSSIREMFKEVNKFNRCIPELDIYSSIREMFKEVNKFNGCIPELDIHSSIRKVFEEQKNFNINTKNLGINNVLYEAIKNIEEFNKESNYLNLENIDRNEIEELKNDLEEIHKENVISLNWQQKIFDVYKKWSEKNPIIALILSIVVTAIISFYVGILLPVKKDASSNSKIINQTTINNITIIGDVKYYYEVETRDNEGNITKGYVSKRKYNQLKSNKTVQK